MVLMPLPLFTKDSVDIDAPLERVWEILTNPALIRQWWDMPMDFGDDSAITVGRKIVWKEKNGNPIVEGTVVSIDPQKSIVIGVRSLTDGPLAGDLKDFTHRYDLTPIPGKIQISFTLGDFAKIPKGEEHFEEARKFGGTELKKIREIAERK